MKKNEKKLPVSPVTLVLLVWLVVLAVYAFAYYIPGQVEMKVLSNNVANMRDEAELMEEYVGNSAPLEKEIEALEQEIDEINSGFINDANVNMMISGAIQRYEITLNSVTLETVTSYEGMRALPINLALRGSTENILAFIDHFEKSEDGAFVVQSAVMEVNAFSTDAKMTLYLCTPSV